MNKPVVLDYQDFRPLRKVYFELGYGLLQKQSYQSAIQNFQKALQETGEVPHDWEIHYLQAQAYQGLSNSLHAFRSYLQAAVHAPEKAAFIIPYAQELLTKKIAELEFSGITSEWQSIIDHPDLNQEGKAEAVFFLGRVHLYSGDYLQAKHLFQQAQQLHPRDVRILEGLGETLWQEDKLDDALEVLKRAYELAKQGPYSERIPVINTRYVRILMAKGEFQESLKLIETILKEGGSYEQELKLMRGQCYVNLGNAEGALAEAETFISGEKTSIHAYLLQIQALIALHRYKEAVNSVNEALTDEPSNPELLFYKIQALIEGQIDLEQAKRLLQRYIERTDGMEELQKHLKHPNLAIRHNDGNAHYFLGQVYFMRHPQWTLNQALEEVEKALTLVMVGTTKYPQAGAWELKGEILLRESQPEEAAEAFYQAGRHRYWDREYNSARALFEQSIEHRPEYVMPYWYLSDSLLVESFSPDPPYVYEEKITQSLKEWENGASIALPSLDDSWAYVVRARISERMGRLPLEDQSSRFWEAVCYLERAILLYDSDYYRWATMSYLCRSIGYYFCALHAANTAQEHKADNLMVIEENAATLINLGEFEGATEFLEKLRQESPSPVYDGWQALVLYYLNKYEKALELLQAGLKEYPEDLWYRMVRADCHRMLDELHLAYEDCEWILEKKDNPDYAHNKTDFAWAAYILGKYEEAIEIYTSVLESPEKEGKESIQWSLSLCYFARGSLQKALDHFEQGLPLLSNKREIEGNIKSFAHLEKTAHKADWPHAKDLIKILNKSGGIKERIEAKREEIYSQQKTALDELKEIAANDEEMEEGSWKCLAVQAGLARLYLEDKQWLKAIDTYKGLQNYPSMFPEANIGLDKAITHFINEGKNLVQKGEFTSAQEIFANAIEQDLSSPERLANVYSLMGVSQIGLDQTTAAQQSFRKSLQLYKSANLDNPGETLGLACSQSVSSIDHYWALDEILAAQSEMLENENLKRNDFTIARATLRNYLSTFFELSKSSGLSANMLPVVTPIAVEFGRDLGYSGPEADWPLLKSYLPEMRERIKNEMGVQVPGVRIRSNETDLPPTTYIIMLDEVPLVSGTIEIKMRYCPVPAEELSASGIPDSELIESINPLTGGDGCWVEPKHWDLLTGKNHALWPDPIFYLVYHLEAVIRKNLDMFFGIQEVENFLELCEEFTKGASLIKEKLGDSASRLQFARVLRQLVREKVSLIPWETIFGAIQDVKLMQTEIYELVRIIRLRLKNYLPGNRPGERRIQLTLKIENQIAPWIQEADSKRFFAIPPEETQDLLSEIRELIGSSIEPSALVVQNAELRHYVRRLVELEFPNLMVISQEELLPEEALNKPLE